MEILKKSAHSFIRLNFRTYESNLLLNYSSFFFFSISNISIFLTSKSLANFITIIIIIVSQNTKTPPQSLSSITKDTTRNPLDKILRLPTTDFKNILNDAKSYVEQASTKHDFCLLNVFITFIDQL